MFVVNVRFKPVGKKYLFACSDTTILDKTPVVVETVRGLELGYTVGGVIDINDAPNEIKNVIRVANKSDIDVYNKNKEAAPLVCKVTKEHARNLNLDIKILEAEYTLDCSKLIIYFESEERVDFRELVKQLAEIYHVRIELRQVGSRDGAKVFGGIGPCGMVVCCKKFLTDFDTVTVKMAKNQNLSLNPVKISGSCGKLLCCINYENQTYVELRKNAPDVGDIVETSEGSAKVLTSDPLNRNLKVKYIEQEKFAYLSYDDVISFRKSKKEE